MDELIKRLSGAGFLTMYSKSVQTLEEIGFIDFLRERARPFISGVGDNSQSLATQAARSAGYFEAIDDLVKFKELYVSPRQFKEKATPDYGGIKESLKQGFIDEKEAEELKKHLQGV